MRTNAVACAEPYGADAARAIFIKGGNAVDAAVAAAFAQCVSNPLGVGIGGTGMMHVYDGAKKECIIVDGSVTIPSGAKPDIFLDRLLEGRGGTTGRYPVRGHPNQYGYQSVMTPGFVSGAATAFERFGSGLVTWADVLEPAIELAIEGFNVYPYLAEYYVFEPSNVPNGLNFGERMAAFPQAAELVLKDGRPYRVGERMVFNDLGRTLQIIAQDGADAFYTGEVGQAIAADFEANDGFMKADDLRDYQPRLLSPLRGTYRGYEYFTSRPPARGLALITMLNILEAYDLAQVGWNTPAYVELLARVQRRSFIEVSHFLMDPKRSDATLERLASKEHAAQLRDEIEQGTDPLTLAPDRILHSEHTTHVTTADERGNIVAFTHSTGSAGASCVVTPGLGFLYNNFLGHFNPRPGFGNSIAPGKRGGGGIPTIMFKEDRPFLAIGSSGGSRLISGVMQTIVNVIDHGMEIAEAIAVPRFHCEEGHTIYAGPELFRAVVAEVEDRGFEVQSSTYMGCNQGIMFDVRSRGLRAGTDPRGGRGIAYWPE